MFCPNLSDPVIKEKFTRLESLHPPYAYHLWNIYQGEVPDKYYKFASNPNIIREILTDQLENAGLNYGQMLPILNEASKMKSPMLVFKGLDGKFKLSGERINAHSGTKGFYTSQYFNIAKEYDKGSGVAIYLYETDNALKNFSIPESEWDNIDFSNVRELEILGINKVDFENNKEGLVLFKTFDGSGEEIQIVVKNADINNKVGLIKDGGFTLSLPVETENPAIMDSRIKNEYADQILSKYLQQEKFKEVVAELIDDAEYKKLPYDKKSKYIQRVIFNKEIRPLESRESIEIVDGYRVIIKPTKKVFKDSANKTAYQNFRGYAYSIANNLNKTYAFTYEPVIAKLEYLDDGKYELVLNVNTSYYKNLIDFIDRVSPEVLMAEIEAITLLEKAAEEAEDHLRLMKEAQTIVVDGEALPFFGELYDSRLESGLAVNNAEYEKIGKVLNFLSSKFKGVSWSFNSYLDKPAQINLLTGEIQFNPALITSETPWHEFGHVIVRNIRQNNPELFEQLKFEIQKLHNENPITSSYAAVEAFYPEYGKSDSFWEEAITTELGRQADVEYRNKENKTIWQTILDFFKGLFDFNVTESTKMKDLVDNLLSKEEVEFISSQYAPGLQERMFARFTRGMKVDMLSKAEQLIPDDEFEFASFGKKIKTFASTILDKDIKGILATAKNIRSEKTLIQESIKSLERIKNLITNEDVAEAYYELATYLKSSNGYLRQVGNAIRLNKENPDINNKIKIMALHSAHKQAVAFEAQVNVLVDMMSEKSKKAIDALTTEEVKERNQNVVLYSIASIKSTIAIIKNEYDKGILDPLSEELLPAITKGNEELKASYQKQIETVKKSNVSDTVKNKRIKEIQKKIEEVVDTKEKVKKLFTDPKKTLLSNIFLDSAFLSNDPTINIVANYIKEGIYDQIPEVQKMNNELQSIQSEITEMLGPNPRAVVDRRSMYNFLVREVEYKYVEDGELKTKTIVALNGKTKTVELQNEITRLKYELEKATTPEEVTRLNNLIDSFYENYTERPFTEEYYQVANSLPLEIRRKRNEIYSQINALRNTIGTGNFDSNFHSDYEAIEMIKELQSELDDMERLYDYKGNKKTGYELEVAEAIINWKKDKRSKNLVSYKLTEQSKSAFEIEYQRQLNIYENNFALAKTEEEKRAAQESWDAWRSINVRTTYTQEFYDRKEEITFRISQLLGNRGNLTEAYDKLFNILKGQRDSSGVYIPSNYSKELIAKSKEVELEIEEIKKAIKADSKIDPEVKAELIPLFKELDELQSTVNSSYYTQTKESIINEIRSEIASRNPNIEDEELNRLTYQKYTSSDWYKENHIIKNRWDDESQSVVSKFEPIFVWRVTRPNNPKYVEQNQPGFVWYKSIVNPEFHNPKYKQGEIQFKEQTSGEYFNQNYNNLTDKQKSIVEKVRTLHYANQKGLYSQDKLGDIIPGMLKSGKDRFIDFVTLGKNPFNNPIERIKNWFQFKDIEADDNVQTYGETQKEFSMADYNADNTLKASKKLFMRFSKPLDAKDQSYDILGAIANYGGASYQFRALRNIQATVLAANRTVESGGVKNMLERVTDKILYGQTLKGNDPVSKSMNAIGRMATGFAGRKSLGFNLLSIPQNLATGFKQNFTMMFSHGLSFSSLRKGTIDASLASKDFFLYHSQLGAKPKSLQLLEFFATEQQNYFTRGSNITSTGIRKWGNILNTINTIREFTEFEIAAQVGFAHLNQYRIKLKDSDNTIPLKDAFEIKDGTLQLKPNVENDQELISFVRNRIYVAQRRAQGIYDTMSQPEADRYALGKLILFLKKWVTSDIKSIYGGSTIHYGAGLETEGSWSAFGQLIRDSIRYKNPIFAYNTATDAVKGGAKKGTLNFAIWLGLINVLSGLRMMTECEEDNNADWADYACYFLKRIINEVEGGFTLWGMNETIYTYGREQSNGITLADKLFGAISGPLGITGRYFSDIDQYTNLDPYYRTTGGNIDWDKTHPMLAGKPALAVGAIEYFGLRGLSITPESMEFNNRRFEDYMPKTYGKDLKTKFTKDYELEEVDSRSMLAKTTRMFKKQYKELNQKRDIKLESGADVTDINNQIDILRRNYEKRMRELDMKVGETEKENFPILPTPFFSDKLDISKEIDTKDLE